MPVFVYVAPRYADEPSPGTIHSPGGLHLIDSDPDLVVHRSVLKAEIERVSRNYHGVTEKLFIAVDASRRVKAHVIGEGSFGTSHKEDCRKDGKHGM